MDEIDMAWAVPSDALRGVWDPQYEQRRRIAEALRPFTGQVLTDALMRAIARTLAALPLV